MAGLSLHPHDESKANQPLFYIYTVQEPLKPELLTSTKSWTSFNKCRILLLSSKEYEHFLLPSEDKHHVRGPRKIHLTAFKNLTPTNNYLFHARFFMFLKRLCKYQLTHKLTLICEKKRNSRTHSYHQKDVQF